MPGRLRPSQSATRAAPQPIKLRVKSHSQARTAEAPHSRPALTFGQLCHLLPLILL